MDLSSDCFGQLRVKMDTKLLCYGTGEKLCIKVKSWVETKYLNDFFPLAGS